MTARRRPRGGAVAGLAALTIALGGCLGATGGGTVPAGSRLVNVFHMAFRPALVTIAAGQEVTWRFEDPGVLHNVDSRSGGFVSPNLDSGTWTHRFAVPGTYEYYCSIHPYMSGEVIVTASST